MRSRNSPGGWLPKGSVTKNDVQRCPVLQGLVILGRINGDVIPPGRRDTLPKRRGLRPVPPWDIPIPPNETPSALVRVLNHRSWTGRFSHIGHRDENIHLVATRGQGSGSDGIYTCVEGIRPVHERGPIVLIGCSISPGTGRTCPGFPGKRVAAGTRTRPMLRIAQRQMSPVFMVHLLLFPDISAFSKKKFLAGTPTKAGMCRHIRKRAGRPDGRGGI